PVGAETAIIRSTTSRYPGPARTHRESLGRAMEKRRGNSPFGCSSPTPPIWPRNGRGACSSAPGRAAISLPVPTGWEVEDDLTAVVLERVGNLPGLTAPGPSGDARR